MLSDSIAMAVQASFHGAAVISGSLFTFSQGIAMGGIALIPSVITVVYGAIAGAVVRFAALTSILFDQMTLDPL